MSNYQYRFNPESISFEKVEKNHKKKIILVLTFLVTAAIFGFVALLASSFLLGVQTPKERVLSQENKELQTQFQLLDKKLATLTSAMEEMEQRDDNIYRALFNTSPVSSQIRESGIGGINRYKHLENLKNADLVVNTAQRLDKLLKKSYIQSKSFDELEEMASNMQSFLASVPAIIPVKRELIRTPPSGYGMRIHPVYKIPKMHEGMDFALPTGSEIYATGDGVVTQTGRQGGYGILVRITHNYGGYVTLYAHMIRAKVKVGDKVKRGDVIGFVGSTGTSTAPHLHYEVHRDGVKLNPANFYFNDLTPEEYAQILEASAQSVQSFD